MWYKVTELNNKGFNKSQISVELGICRKTVRNYLSMNESEFKAFLDRSREASKKLTPYEGFVKGLLEKYAYLSAAQIEDRLKEHHADFPAVHSKTIYNFTQYIRGKYQLAKEKVKEPRVYEKLPESEYGAFAQVDFGQTYMLTTAARKKVHFMAMVLCRSRHKFVYFQSSPFTSACAVAAHQKAFEYFEGQPHAIIYDQDRVFIRDENMGDLLLTQTFKEYVASCDFEAIFCRKSDPESKGKIENVIKYVKNNFCKGRIYSGGEELNRLALGWLERTANGTVHHGTKQIPHEVWKEEKNYLQPLRGTIISKPIELKRYKVRKDNTIHYKSNFYTLPRGTYKHADMWVQIEEKDGQVKFFDEERKLITTHSLCIDRGKTIRNTDHQRDKSRSIQEIKDSLLTLLGNSTAAILYTDKIHQKKGRYVRDNFNHMLKVGAGYSSALLQKALETCLESSLYNAYQFEDVLKYQHKQQQKKHSPRVVSLNIVQKEKKDHSQLIPTTSCITTYSQFF